MSNYKNIKPTAILMGGLALVGGYLYYQGEDVLWGGFIAMMVFYGLIFFLGSYAANLRKTDSSVELMLAGRSMPLWIAVFTMSATWIGGGYINGTAEYTASSGLAWVQAPWGYALSLVIGGIFFARIMRRHKFKTMLDPLDQRYGKKMTAVLFLPALTGEIFWTAAILTALGTTFATVLGLSFTSSIILSAAIAIAYTALGGLWAVALTDILQMTLLMLGLFLIVPFALEHVGGWDSAWAAYVEKKGSLASFLPPIDGWRHPDWGNYYWNWIDFALLLMFGGVAWQVYFQRVLAAANENVAMRLSIFAGLVCLVAAIPAIIIGVVGDVVDWSTVGVAAPENAAITLPYVARYLTNPVVATISLGAIAAAVMSSVDSSILSASSMAAWNVYRPFSNYKSNKKEDATDSLDLQEEYSDILDKPNSVTTEKLSKVIRNCIWIIGIAATLLALRIESVYALWFLCSDFVYCLLFPQLVTALYDKKANVYGSAAGFAIAAILRFGGGDATLGIPTIIPYPMIEEGVVLFPFRTLAMVSGLVAIMVVSRLTQGRSPAKALRVMED